MGEDTLVAGGWGSSRRSSAKINSKRLAASCYNLVAVELRCLLGQRRFFTNSSDVTANKGNVPTGALCLVVLIDCLCDLVVFSSIMQERLIEVQKRLLHHCFL